MVIVSNAIEPSVTAGRAPVYADPPVHLQQQYLELQTKALEAKVQALETRLASHDADGTRLAATAIHSPVAEKPRPPPATETPQADHSQKVAHGCKCTIS